MSEVLQRKFIAINCQGNELHIIDIAQLIRDYGFRLFLSKFGFTHGKLSHREEYLGSEWRRDELGFPYHKTISKTVIRSEFEYIIKDAHGKHYSPEYLVSLFSEAYPKESERMWLKENRSYRYWRWGNGFKSTKNANKRISKYYSLPFKKGVWQSNETLKEEGLKPVRDIKQHMEAPYDDHYYRDPQRSWKSHRKTQYK